MSPFVDSWARNGKRDSGARRVKVGFPETRARRASEGPTIAESARPRKPCASSDGASDEDREDDGHRVEIKSGDPLPFYTRTRKGVFARRIQAITVEQFRTFQLSRKSRQAFFEIGHLQIPHLLEQTWIPSLACVSIRLSEFAGVDWLRT